MCLLISVACFLPFLSTYRFLCFAISFISLILLFHSVTLAFCFPFSLNHPLVVLFLLSRPIFPFPASPVPPDVGQKKKKSATVQTSNSLMSLRYSVAFPSFSLLSSLSLPAADLWDQPSKTDSHFFTDHQYVSGYTTASEGE